jgi:acyl transferase domain-containing protein/NADPH:quinone reductase-like Zn-dependent oxidoreductase
MSIEEIVSALREGTIDLQAARAAIAALPRPQAPEGAGSLVIAGVHTLDELGLQALAPAAPDPHEIGIEVRASAVNFPDLLCVRGLYPTLPDYPFVAGFEVAGVVTALGAGVTDFALGDSVIALTGSRLGGHGTYVNVPCANAAPKPCNLSFEDACSLPVAFGTVAQAFAVGGLVAGEHVLVQTAAGGCGLAALQLAWLQNCVCYGTSSRADKLAFLRRIGVEQVFDYRAAFDEQVLAATRGRGVDVVLNMLAGEPVQRGIDSLAAGGRYLELAVHGLKTCGRLDLSRLVNNQSFHSIDLRRLALERGIEFGSTLRQVVTQAEAGELVPTVSRVYPATQIVQALELVDSGKHIGKVVISRERSSPVDLTEQCADMLGEHRRRCQRSARPRVRSQVPSATPTQTPAIAVIGIAGRFPQAADIEQFWSNIIAGRDCVVEVPEQRWPARAFYDPEPGAAGKTPCKWLGLLDDADCFDPLFFGISPAEAEWIDPQQRIFLEECWHCLEDAGLSPQSLSGSNCGVFAGCARGDYAASSGDLAFNAQSLMGGATSILAARISYFLNLQGPCVAIDTACSSALVSIAAACDALLLDRCELALAGGVSVLAGPSLHVMAGSAGMLSGSGRCFTFDNRADGFVPGEGVGVLLLKKLPDAIRDGDRIRGVIRGWGVNQDGRTNGITAPSVRAQSQLQQEVYRRFAIDAATIGLIEAHGTATKLGDPIEIEALTAAFRAHTDQQHYCAVGSVKSNIGHLLAAAGAAGIIKALLAAEKGVLPPTIHFRQLNEHIELERTPFYINTEARRWQASPGTPRRAAVSSFGFSGTNAHLVVEEYIAAPGKGLASEPTPRIPGAELIVLSARTADRLRQQAENLLAHLRANRQQELRTLAYTLQVGRDAMEHRLAIVAASTDEAVAALQGYLQAGAASALFLGRARRRPGAAVDDPEDEVQQQALQQRLAQRELIEIARSWVRGAAIHWDELYESRPARIALPSYPFQKSRYWIGGWQSPGSRHSESATPARRVLHPLVHENTSSLQEQRFSATYSGDEFFIGDHSINGQKVLPGAAYLEIARVAVQRALDLSPDAAPAVTLRNVTWSRPAIAGGEPLELQIALVPTESDELEYEIFGTNAGERVLFSQGRAAAQPIEHRPQHDLNALRMRCTTDVGTPEQWYERAAAMGLQLGPSYRAIQQIAAGRGEHGRVEALAQLQLPSHLRDTSSQLSLHPSLVDAALQSSFALTMIDGAEAAAQGGKLVVPFCVDRVQVFAACPQTCWTWVRESAATRDGAASIKVDIDICDGDGAVCVHIEGVNFRAVEASQQATGTALLHVEWQECTQAQSSRETHYDVRHVLLCEDEEYSEATGTILESCRVEIARRLPLAQCTVLRSESTGLAERYGDLGQQVLQLIQSLAADRGRNATLLQLVIPVRGSLSVLPALSALLRTAHLEYPDLITQLIEMPIEHLREELIDRLQQAVRLPQHPHLRFCSGSLLVPVWRRTLAAADPSSPWRDGGTYLICGGIGGLGRLIAAEIAGAVKEPTLILTGRSAAPGGERQAQLEALRMRGARVEYRQLDLGDAAAVRAAVLDVHRRFGTITGILHLAGVTRDGRLNTKSSADWTAVLEPKVLGLINLDEASGHLPLELFIAFSSLAGVTGSPGQGEYAAANAFMDAYLARRAARVRAQERQGRTLSIAWPLWTDGGMQVDGAFKRNALRQWGLLPLPTPQGLRTLAAAVSSAHGQLAVIHGHVERGARSLFGARAPGETSAATAAARSTNASPNAADHSLALRIEQAVQTLVVEMLKLDGPADLDMPFNEFGFDSIMLTQFTRRLNDTWALDLTPPVLFEHPTLRSLTDYLAREHGAQIAHTLDGLAGPRNEPAREAAPQSKPAVRASRRAPRRDSAEPIAIIGMSGRFPRARDLDEYWRNLREGLDCIGEVPAQRWDWREFFGDPAHEDNKTNVRWGGFMDGIDEFDPLFFGISPREAQLMDPQQRLLMMYTWKAIEDAGYAPHSMWGTRTAVLVGTGCGAYDAVIARANIPVEAYTSTGVVPSVGPNRISYLLNLRGPSEPIETACSSSLVAIHRAITAIHANDCDMALVGGVNTIITPSGHISFSKAGMLCTDGRCKAFSKQANGYVRGEGVGMLLLKRLSAAERDGDHIYASILGSAENHGGRTNSLTAPNPAAQAELIKTAHRHIDPRLVTYIGAHGTGTPLGDSVEINALKSAFQDLYAARGATAAAGHCGVASVKSNIGHLELAAGVAGVIKVLLQMKHGQLVQSLHCQELHPYVRLEGSPFYIVRELTSWTRLRDAAGRELPRCAAVSSFGFGGVNAHVVLQESLARERQRSQYATAAPPVVVLSARTAGALKRQALQLLDAIQSQDFGPGGLADIAYTLQVGRDAMDHRLALRVTSIAELATKLTGWIRGERGADGVYSAEVASRASPVAPPRERPVSDGASVLDETRIGEQWVQGVPVDW